MSTHVDVGRYGVNMTATLNRPDRGTAPSDTGQPVEGHTGRHSTPEFVAFMRRLMPALVRRMADADLDVLRELAVMQRQFDEVVDQAVAVMRHDPTFPASWAQIGDAFGITRQAAQKRFGHLGGIRQVGGQPGNLR